MSQEHVPKNANKHGLEHIEIEERVAAVVWYPTEHPDVAAHVLPATSRYPAEQSVQRPAPDPLH